MVTSPHGFVRLAAAAPRLRVADPGYNLREVLSTFARAEAQGVQVLVLPELSLTGYTAADLLFSLETLVRGAERALETFLQETKRSSMLVALGLPALQGSRLFNVAALAQKGSLRGVVPKTFIPGYKEFYEERWFASGREAEETEITLAGHRVPFGADLVFSVRGEDRVSVGVEICEDLWVPFSPSSRHAMAGATILLNLSASPEGVGKADYRRSLVTMHSARTLSAYAYAGCGASESTTDLVFAGHLMVAENGVSLGESRRFDREGSLLVCDVDTERLLVERARQGTFAEGRHPHRRVEIDPIPAPQPVAALRSIDRSPFVPTDPATLDRRCEEIVAIQTAALAKRLEHTKLRRVVLGLSGGLDSTLAALICARTFDSLGIPRKGILAVTLPGFGTSASTRRQAQDIARCFSFELREIDIRPACELHMRDIGLEATDRSSVTFQNLQARERTQILMDLANKEGGLVVGTGDLSELALGWCTFAGDHISMYNVNASVPKTLVKGLVAFIARQGSAEERRVLEAVLATPVSPELLPPSPDGSISQRTEDILGPYEIHDFFLFCFLRMGASPGKVLFLAKRAFPEHERHLKAWLKVFLERFFDEQFKRSVLPDGPKVGSVSLSPRGDWRMPSDASKAAWLEELEGEAD